MRSISVEKERIFWYNLSMTSNQIYQRNYTAFQSYMLVQIPENYDVIAKDDIFYTVLEIVEGVKLDEFINFKRSRSDGYDRLALFSALLLSLAIHGKLISLRDLERECRYDVRFQFLLNGDRPSYKTFERFINEDLCLSIEQLLEKLNLYIMDHTYICRDILYIDGTKFEAYANKMTFVWKKATDKFYTRNWAKAINVIQALNKYFDEKEIEVRYSILKKPSFMYLLKITDKLEDYVESIGLLFVHGKGKRKSELQRLYEQLAECAIKMMKYEIHYDLFQGRNSFSKTDPDAAFLHMKYDYYNHTNVFKPGYNVQMGVMDGYIMNILINTDANDMGSFEATVEKYKEMYGAYPKGVCADAGYGSKTNYKYCNRNSITPYIKYPSYEKEQKKRTEKNKFKSIQFERDENHMPICPAGYAFEIEKIYIRSDENQLPETFIMTRNTHCQECPMKSKCTKAKNGRTMKIDLTLEAQKSKVRNILSSDEGKQIMTNRSIQSEGAFGILKEDYGFDCLSRRGETGVKIEVYSASVGFNIRKYHKARIKMINQKESEENQKSLKMC